MTTTFAIKSKTAGAEDALYRRTGRPGGRSSRIEVVTTALSCRQGLIGDFLPPVQAKKPALPVLPGCNP